MRRTGTGLLALSFLGMLLAPSVALAQAYRWVDEQGKVHYSEGLDSVPPKYRETAKPIEFPKAPPPPPPAPSPEKTEGEKKPAEKPGEPEKPKESGG
ncbi:MAG: hypothetical protein A3I03_00520 [Candidatus Rokubacteria bacterium RIFCSPLOWO2_02_FULL_68_19]|nr:MAG: hypothetical protein A3I03_00520 [Candidatus Rokubacteria bacterium RIFCSPLOWO2_02_FULL_68_19]